MSTKLEEAANKAFQDLTCPPADAKPEKEPPRSCRSCRLIRHRLKLLGSRKKWRRWWRGRGSQTKRRWKSCAIVRSVLGIGPLMHARGVSRAWCRAVDKALPLLPCITVPVHITVADVVAVLTRVAGANLKTVCLQGCRQLRAADVERILQRLAEGCPAVVEVYLAGCRDDAIVRALAIAAQKKLRGI